MNTDRFEINSKIKKILVGIATVGIFVLIASTVLFLEGPKKGERTAEKRVINGGVIGGPIKIGKKRMKVLGGNETKRWVWIQNNSLSPRVKRINDSDVLYIKNLDEESYIVDFMGYRKEALLHFNQSYRLKFIRKGTYNYRVAGKNVSMNGTVLAQ